jgi:predicted nucleic acid-binding protein
MSRYLLDTGIVQDFINRRNGVQQRVDAARHTGNRIGICTPVLGELWAGVEGSISRERNLQRLRLALSRLVVWPYTNEAAEQSGSSRNSDESPDPCSKSTSRWRALRSHSASALS